MTAIRTIGMLLCLALLLACSASATGQTAQSGALAASASAPPASAAKATTAPTPAATQAATSTPGTAEAPARSAPAPVTEAPTEPTVTPTAAAASSAQPDASAAPPQPPAWIYPLRLAGRQPGDGFLIRHGFQTENTWYNPGDWHAGEDWYALEGDTAGAEVIAVAPGVVEYADGNYPGRVVIIRHEGGLYSMYGHLDNALSVAAGRNIERGQVLGTVLRRDDETPNHLHFETRSFLVADPVNGPAPRYPYRCGPQCAPGPGYWPISAPELPGAVGWLNPTHTIAANAWPEPGRSGEVVVATTPAQSTADLFDSVDENGVPSGPAGTFSLEPGARFQLLEARSGPRQPSTTGAESYSLWYRLALPDGREVWASALAASDTDTGSDGRPSSVRFNFLPVALSE